MWHREVSRCLGLGWSCVLFLELSHPYTGPCPGRFVSSFPWGFPHAQEHSSSPSQYLHKHPVFQVSSCQESLLWYSTLARLRNASFLQLIETSIFSSFLFTRAKHWKQLICETVKKFKKWILMKYKSITKMMILFTREMLSEKKDINSMYYIIHIYKFYICILSLYMYVYIFYVSTLYTHIFTHTCSTKMLIALMIQLQLSFVFFTHFIHSKFLTIVVYYFSIKKKNCLEIIELFSLWSIPVFESLVFATGTGLIRAIMLIYVAQTLNFVSSGLETRLVLCWSALWPSSGLSGPQSSHQ